MREVWLRPPEDSGPVTGDVYVSAGEAAAIIGIAPASLMLLAEAGRIPSMRTALGRRFKLDDIAHYAEWRASHHLAVGSAVVNIAR